MLWKIMDCDVKPNLNTLFPVMKRNLWYEFKRTSKSVPSVEPEITSFIFYLGSE